MHDDQLASARYRSAQPGEIITFGSYPQTADGLEMVKLLSAHGQPLSVYSHRLMVIARKPL